MNAMYHVSTHGYFDVDPQTGSVSTAGRPDTGGQTVYTVELVKALGQMGHPTFLVTRWFDPTKPELQQIGPNAWLLRVRGGRWGFVPKESVYKLLPELSDRLISFIERDWEEMFREAGLAAPESVQPALIHGHYVDGGLVALEVARQFRVPFFWTSHSLGALKRERMDGDEAVRAALEKQFKFEHRIHEESRLILAAAQRGGQTVTAQTELADIQRLYELDVPHVEFIPPGVDINKFHPANIGETDNPIPGLPTSGPIVMMGGRIAKTKGYELALQAFREVLREIPDANLVFFGGSDNPTEEESEVLQVLDDYREKEGIARRVFLLGGLPHDRLPSLFRRADVFLLPSRHEPFGMVALEAACCGTPLVLSSHAGLAGELENGRDCLIAEPEDTSAFAQAILAVLLNPDRAHAIAHQGMETINGHYSWEGIASRHINFWRTRGANV